jgi:ABC-type Fe3+-hydroxamate transport system substrate-binding protein
MPVYTDQLNRTIHVSSPPHRIISLVPSQTELLFDLGLEEEVIGITKFCVHPQRWFREKSRIGGTKNVHLEKVASLQPDLIIANKEENVKEQVEELAQNYPVWISDVNNLEDAISMIESIGAITGKKKVAQTITSTIHSNFHQLQTQNSKPQTRTAYLIWKDPYMTVGGDTFIHHMLEAAGFQNFFESRCRYPQITIEDLQAADCNLLLLSSEPYPFKQKHIDELQQHLPHTKILLVDGELFSWYGSRLLKAPAYFQNLQKQISAIQ